MVLFHYFFNPTKISGKKYYGLKTDLWSCGLLIICIYVNYFFIGIVLFSMVCGHLPFEDMSTMGLYKKILSGVFNVP